MLRRVAFLLALAVLAGAAAGCGGSGGSTPTTCSSPQRTKALARLKADLVALRRAADHPGKDTFSGSPAVNKATDRFLLDVSTAPIGNLERNRMIDHAAAALVGACRQCFQALEANRPIPAIAQGDNGACAP